MNETKNESSTKYGGILGGDAANIGQGGVATMDTTAIDLDTWSDAQFTDAFAHLNDYPPEFVARLTAGATQRGLPTDTIT